MIYLRFNFSASNSRSDVSCDSSASRPSFFAPELQIYLNYKVDLPNDGEFDQKLWWQINKSKFPILYKIFLKYAFVPASSSAVESEFSYTGLIITDRRSRILPEHVNELMIARNDC